MRYFLDNSFFLILGTNNFNYKTKIEHNYKYFVNISTLFQGTSKNESSLQIESDVSLEFLSECDGLLQITNVKLADKLNKGDEEDAELPQSNQFSEAISEYTLRFSFHDGVISEICPTDEETNWVLNFKRGLLSMLHNTMKRFDLDYDGSEDDVRGSCKTAYKVIGPSGTSLIIEKTKDLASCIHRSKLHAVVQSTPYRFRPVSKNQSVY